MNLALGAVFLAILLFPALVLTYVLVKGTHARRMPSFTLIEYLLVSAVLSLFIHGMSIWAMRILFDREPDYIFIFKFLSSQVMIDGKIAASQDQLREYFFDFSLYTFVVCLVSGVVGFGIQRGFTSKKLRTWRPLQRWRKNRKPAALLCYYNDWWYFFRANEYSSEFAYLGKGEVLIFVDVLMDSKDATILYSGILVDFVLDADKLEFIYLSGVSHKIFTHKDEAGKVSITDTKSADIPNSGIMCIPYDNIINLYVRFASLELPGVERLVGDALDKKVQDMIIIEPEDSKTDPNSDALRQSIPPSKTGRRRNKKQYAIHKISSKKRRTP